MPTMLSLQLIEPFQPLLESQIITIQLYIEPLTTYLRSKENPTPLPLNPTLPVTIVSTVPPTQ